MPGIRENVTRTITQNAGNGPAPKPAEKKTEYSARSPVLRAYQAGLMPPDHRRLLDAVKQLLGEGVTEGNIQLEDALKITGYFRASALKMLQHMQNFGVLKTRRGYRETWVEILKD